MKNLRNFATILTGLLISYNSFSQSNALDDVYTPGKSSPYNAENNSKNSYQEGYKNSLSIELLSVGRGAIAFTYDRQITDGFSVFASAGAKPLPDFIGTLLLSNDLAYVEEKNSGNQISSYEILQSPFSFESSKPFFQLGFRILSDGNLEGKGAEVMYRTYNETFLLEKQTGDNTMGYTPYPVLTSKVYKPNIKTSMLYLGYRNQGFSDKVAWGVSYGIGLRFTDFPTLEVTEQSVQTVNGITTYQILEVNNKLRKRTVSPIFLFTYNIGLGF